MAMQLPARDGGSDTSSCLRLGRWRRGKKSRALRRISPIQMVRLEMLRVSRLLDREWSSRIKIDNHLTTSLMFLSW